MQGGPALAGPGVPRAPALELDCLLASRASELTGNAQTTRNELFALFGIWVGFSDKSLPKQAAEAQDTLLRDDARRLYLQALANSGARLRDAGHSAVVSWSGWTAERKVSNGRSAARNAFVDILRKYVSAASQGVHRWPILARPGTDPARAPPPPAPEAALLGDVPEEPAAGASSSKTAEEQAHARVLAAGCRSGRPFASPFATRRVKKGDIGVVVEQVRPSQHGAPFLRVDFGAGRGVVDFNSVCCGPAAARRADTPMAPVDFGSIRDFDAFSRHAERVAGIAIKASALHRLYELFKLIHSTDAPVKRLELDPDNARNCVLGFKHLTVRQPEFYQKVCELLKSNVLWQGLSRRTTGELKSPRWVVYKLLRQIGVAPVRHSRGPKEHDPGPREFMYAGDWVFDKHAFAKQCHLLQVHTAQNTHESSYT